MERFKGYLAVAQSLATLVALIVGGAWGAYLFDKERQHYANAQISYKITHHPLDRDKLLLHVAVEVKNLGKTLLGIGGATIWVQQIDPVQVCAEAGKTIAERIDAALTSQEMNTDTLPWCLIKKRSSEWKAGDLQIEPAESDEIYFDFIVPSTVKLVKVYFRVAHTGSGKGSPGLVWQREVVHSLQPK